MQPLFNSFPHQCQSNGMSTAHNQQPLLTNPSLGNSCNPMQNLMTMQSQVGIFNHQVPVPFNNSSTLLSNRQTMPAMPFLMTQQPTFTSTPNNMGLPQMGQYHMGLSAQNHVNNLNAVSMFVNQVNPCQVLGQTFAPNIPNFPQQLAQNMGFPNSQVNPVLPIQMPNHSQSGLQTVAAQNPNFFANPLVGVGQQVYPSEKNFVLPSSGRTELKPLPTPTQQVQAQVQWNSSTQNSQCSALNRQQGKNIQNGSLNSNGKVFRGKDLKRNLKRESSKLGYQRSQFNHAKSKKRRSNLSHENKQQGRGHQDATKFIFSKPMDQASDNKRMSLALSYTEQEIKKWREERRKNYPSKANIEKKQTAKLAGSDVIDRDAKSRREELREILAKQAELGVEVAEIPSYYLSDFQKQANRGENSRTPQTKKGRFQNRHAKRGRYNRKNQSAEQQTLIEKDFLKRNPTLLQKLLSADIRRDKRRLLQVFRFMVVNSFLKDWPEKPLKFPLVVLQEDEFENEVVEGKSSPNVNNGSEVTKRTAEGSSVDVNGDEYKGGSNVDSSDDDEEQDAQLEREMVVRGKAVNVGEISRAEEEEGEIID
uniref:FMR1-interacting protein 1 conserved domain-containing protein n=1 Tax=Rhizophora mucronata TaxID=61149 RepID=A0A2P2IQ73_RHIMU